MSRKRSRSGKSGGSWSRRAALVGLGGIVVGTGVFSAFDQITADRGVDVGAAGDEDALLGFSGENPKGVSGEVVDLFELTNRFGEDVDEISVTQIQTGDEDLDIVDIDPPDDLRASDAGFVEGELSCQSDVSDADVTFEITATSDGQSVVMERTIQATCEEVFDPFDCQDVFDRGLEQPNTYKGSELTLCGRNDVISDNVAMFGGDVEVDITGSAVIEGFLRIDSDDDVEFEMGSTARIQGAVAIDAEGDVEIELSGDPSIEGDLCVEADGEVEIEGDGDNAVEGDIKIVSDNEVEVELQGNPAVEGDVKIDGDDEITVELEGDPAVWGEVDEDWDSDELF